MIYCVSEDGGPSSCTLLDLQNHLINSKSLYQEKTMYTKTPLITKLSKIVRKRLETHLVPPAEVCGTCHSLLDLVDEHESKLLAYENEVRLKFKLPFPIVLEDKNDVAPPPFDDQPIGEPQMGSAANAELEPGPDDVIVSADDTGLVTVTYSQPDADSDAGRPPGPSSPAVIWDGDSDQQIIIFKEEETPVVGLLDDLVPAEPPVARPVPSATSRPPEVSNRPPAVSSHPPPPPPLPPPPQPPVQPPSVFFCDVCDAPFTSTEMLASHRSTHPLLRFQCVFCAERCATTKELSRHMNEAHADQLMPCGHCDKRFATKAGLKQHVKQHEERRHVCPLCPRRFVALHDLQLHSIYKHSDERPFSCDVCRRTFKTLCILRRHKLRHTGLKPHTCAHCGMTFTHKFAMEAHAVSHQSHRLKCATCGKKFGLQRSLEQHMRLMHRQEVYVS
ncbi:zinc finger protein 771-like isoform X1 [Amphibalanus amphitrite]|uniref:zinc finger protein 771-like isoform X1 n=1 Tax=Amphibalanus amphitrite TaxID=1232801 RepID=UPI001C900AB0|nr:zinc finger protein 771-like isoform X1 [Amphibalanus amphitrite]